MRHKITSPRVFIDTCESFFKSLADTNESLQARLHNTFIPIGTNTRVVLQTLAESVTYLIIVMI